MSNVECRAFLPQLEDVEIEWVEASAAGVRIGIRARDAAVPCPRCGTASERVHGRYQRRVNDLAVSGRKVTLVVTVRRLRCLNLGCDTVTFAEQIPGLTTAYGRYTTDLNATLAHIGLTLAGRAGSRMTEVLGIPVGKDTLLRRVRALPDPAPYPVKVLGIDDFAVRRGHRYGTVLIDCETRRVVDMLPGRDAAPLTAWLQEHPAPEVICRDRASAYAEAARTGAPHAVQVADRFHLWQNLATAVERCVTKHRTCLDEHHGIPDTTSEQSASSQPGTDDEPAGAMAQRGRAHHALVHELLAQGAGHRQIARHLGWSNRTVAAYANAATWQEMLVVHKRRPSLVDAFAPFLIRRIGEGCRNAHTLYHEVAAEGFTGSYAIVRRFVQQYRHKPDLTTVRRPPTIRQVTSWICRRPQELANRDTEQLQAILNRCPELQAAQEFVRTFADMLTHRTGQRLGTWIAKAEHAALPGITKFAAGLTADLAAVTAGLSLPYNSGPVEGNINRIKMLKRQMFGRANLDLLRKRAILA